MTSLPEMPCQELVEVITEYLESALGDRDRRRFEAHLAECEPCRDYLEQFRQTIALSGRVEPERLPPRMRDELLAAFRDWRHRT
jgi:anti-sigma factor RsiW